MELIKKAIKLLAKSGENTKGKTKELLENAERNGKTEPMHQVRKLRPHELEEFDFAYNSFKKDVYKPVAGQIGAELVDDEFIL